MSAMPGPERRRIIIMGAAGRDFHNFNLVYRDDPGCEVVAFTAAQIPEIVVSSRGSSMSGNPRELSGEELTRILEELL